MSKRIEKLECLPEPKPKELKPTKQIENIFKFCSHGDEHEIELNDLLTAFNQHTA